MIRVLPAIGLLCFLTGCAPQNIEPPKTQLEVRQFQTREYRTADTKQVMKAILDVLQDDGYIVSNAVVDLGLLTASKEVDIENPTERFFSLLADNERAVWSKNQIVEASANVSRFGEQTRVRVNFRLKVLDNRGGTVRIEQIEDSAFYQEFFSKVDKGIFLAGANV